MSGKKMDRFYPGRMEKKGNFRNNDQQRAISPSADFPALQWLKIKLRTFSLRACRKQALSLAGEVTWHLGKTRNFPGTATQIQIQAPPDPATERSTIPTHYLKYKYIFIY